MNMLKIASKQRLDDEMEVGHKDAIDASHGDQQLGREIMNSN